MRSYLDHVGLWVCLSIGYFFLIMLTAVIRPRIKVGDTTLRAYIEDSIESEKVSCAQVSMHSFLINPTVRMFSCFRFLLV